MGWMEILFLLVMITLCLAVIKTDITEGMVYNKTLLIFFVLAIIMDFFYYGFFYREMIFPFVVNIIVVSIASLCLFYSHCFAGGDCKLIIVLSLLYPSKCYISYGNNLITVVFTIGIAVFYGYIYLLVTSIYGLAKKDNKMSGNYVKGYLCSFLKSFFTALIYISAVTFILHLLAEIGLFVPVWLTRVICIIVSWGAGRYPILRKKQILISTLAGDIVLAIWLKLIPFSIHPENYILVVALLICQMTIKTSLYQEISIDEIKKGMILSMGSTVLMQNSRVRGLPKISSEDLRDRLTEDEVDSVKRWAKGKKVETLTIVKKIPFATFIALGFVSYMCAWGLLSWV